MRRIIVATIVASVLLVTVSFFATQALAEDVKFRVTCYLTKVEAIPVGDVEGHVILVYERRGVAILENGECAAYLTRGTADLTKHQGPFQGYCQLTYKDGSTTISKHESTMSISPGEKLPSLKGKGEWIKGTGKFQGIRGSFSFTGKYITPYSKETKGDVYIELTGTYTLPSK
jgi:hypothetical protein